MTNVKKVTDERPWGHIERFTHNTPSTVKILTVSPKHRFSLQHHQHRDEFWRILSGSATVTMDEVSLEASSGDEFFIPRNTKHRIEAGDTPVTVLEIAMGDFDEDDIVRIEDDYGRT